MQVKSKTESFLKCNNIRKCFFWGVSLTCVSGAVTHPCSDLSLEEKQCLNPPKEPALGHLEWEHLPQNTNLGRCRLPVHSGQIENEECALQGYAGEQARPQTWQIVIEL